MIMKKQKRQVSFLIGILLLAFMLFAVLIVAVAAFMFTDRLPAVGRPTVALVRITGIISECSFARGRYPSPGR